MSFWIASHSLSQSVTYDFSIFSALQSCRRHMWQSRLKQFGYLVTWWHSWLFLTNWETEIVTSRVSDWQSDSDLDTLRNSCEVFYICLLFIFFFLYLRWAVLEISGAGPDLVTTGNWSDPGEGRLIHCNLLNIEFIPIIRCDSMILWSKEEKGSNWTRTPSIFFNYWWK